MKKLFVALSAIFLTVSLSAQEKSLTGSELLIRLEADFARATAQGGHAAFVSWFAEDGVELDDGGGISTTQDMLKQGPWPPDFSLSWTPVKAEMASSGDLGFTYGNYILKSKNKEGQLVTHYGKYMSIWKKQKDGSWKVIADMGNSSPEPTKR